VTTPDERRNPPLSDAKAVKRDGKKGAKKDAKKDATHSWSRRARCSPLRTTPNWLRSK